MIRFLTAVGMATLAAAFPAGAAQKVRVAASQVRVVDGDTLQIGRTRVRAVGYDTPEKGAAAKCSAERDLAAKATARMKELVSPPHVLTALWSKGKDNYGRSLARFYSDHKEIGQILISEGLAHAYDGKSRASWC